MSPAGGTSSRRASRNWSASILTAAASPAAPGTRSSAAREEIAILVHAALFLAEDPTTRRLLADQARAGVRVRWLLGDPSSVSVARRSEEEGIGPATVGAKITVYTECIERVWEQAKPWNGEDS
jgi:hypothetical protein